jgi:hypothetical protein
MKNIHVIPTDKPSRLLYFGTSKELTLHVNPVTFRVFERSTQNIYITSDEDPKNKDYYWDENKLKVKRYFESRESFPSLLHRFKVILTTDPTLIADGVQSIDDAFLEWFVKNPNCESVEVKEEDYSQKCRECGEYVKRGYICNRGCFMKSGNFIPTNKNIKYKIIIPQEEPKTNLDRLPFPELVKEFAEYYENVPLVEKPKQETFEEAAEKYAESKSSNFTFRTTHIRDFKAGAKWQAERMYIEVFEWLATKDYLSDKVDIIQKEFEQFKKK